MTPSRAANLAQMLRIVKILRFVGRVSTIHSTYTKFAALLGVMILVPAHHVRRLNCT